jgi:His/Glu/Gln/Arg/opine family amino acid ABC transporter permease subunit
MQNYRFNWSVVFDNLPMFFQALWVDIWIAIAAFVMALCIGLLAAMMSLSRSPIARWTSFAWVQFMRGVPIYVMLVWVYFGISAALRLPFSAIEAALIALTLCGSAYTCEAFRSGLQAVPQGQIDAGRAVGLGEARLFLDVVLPQAIRYVIPPLASVFVIMIKWATLASVIAVADMIYFARQVTIQNFTPFEAYFAVAVIFVLVTSVLSYGVALLERWLRVPS